MTLAAFASAYGDFYAPSFAVRLGGRDLVRDLEVPVSQVEVDLVLGAASRFAFTVSNCYQQEHGQEPRAFATGRASDLLELLAFGAEIEISLGYGDASSRRKLIAGVITELSTSFPEGGSPELAVAGYDHGFLLTMGKSSRSWKERPDSYAVQEIAGFRGLAPAVETTRERQAQIEQNQESDWEFLKKLATRNHFELYVDEERRLHFARPADKSAPVVDLVYGEGLLSFKPEANLAGQVSRVEVYGWDTRNKRAIVGRADAGEESGLTGKSPGQHLAALVRDADKRPVLRLRQPVFTQSEADQRAKAALNDRAKQFLTGEGESIGLPEIRPDRKVKLGGLGARFSRPYYVQQATHKLDASGYRTRFKVKETGL